MEYKNITFNPKICSASDVINRPENHGLEFVEVKYINEFEAVAIFKVQSKPTFLSQKDFEAKEHYKALLSSKSDEIVGRLDKSSFLRIGGENPDFDRFIPSDTAILIVKELLGNKKENGN